MRPCNLIIGGPADSTGNVYIWRGSCNHYNAAQVLHVLPVTTSAVMPIGCVISALC